MKKPVTIFIIILINFLINNKAKAQFLMDMVDTTKDAGRGLLNIYKKYDHLKIGGYIQPQFQIASEKGIKSFDGGDFSTQVANRFMLRRSRIRLDYIHYGDNKLPGVQTVFQIDANERGITLRDVWGRVFENKFKLFSFTTGMFARPFGYEVNYSSSDRESPERGRMSQLLMKSERDLGAMITFEPRKTIKYLNNIKVDIGAFNGQGINATGDFDNTKDIIARVSLKSISISKKVKFSFGISTLQGGIIQNTKFKYLTGITNGIKSTQVDSSFNNLWSDAPRKYYGADAQLKMKKKIGYIELRAEYITGEQPGTTANSETPVVLISSPNDGFHVRNFNGAYFYYVQNVFSLKHQIILKYDWFDPNVKVKGSEIGLPGSNLSSANIKYSTLGLGYLNYLTENIKCLLYYSIVKNESTSLSGYRNDLKDNVMTFRLQFRF